MTQINKGKWPRSRNIQLQTKSSKNRNKFYKSVYSPMKENWQKLEPKFKQMKDLKRKLRNNIVICF